MLTAAVHVDSPALVGSPSHQRWMLDTAMQRLLVKHIQAEHGHGDLPDLRGVEIRLHLSRDGYTASARTVESSRRLHVGHTGARKRPTEGVSLEDICGD